MFPFNINSPKRKGIGLDSTSSLLSGMRTGMGASLAPHTGGQSLDGCQIWVPTPPSASVDYHLDAEQKTGSWLEHWWHCELPPVGSTTTRLDNISRFNGPLPNLSSASERFPTHDLGNIIIEIINECGTGARFSRVWRSRFALEHLSSCFLYRVIMR